MMSAGSFCRNRHMRFVLIAWVAMFFSLSLLLAFTLPAYSASDNKNFRPRGGAPAPASKHATSFRNPNTAHRNSTDPLDEWTLRTSPVPTVDIHGITYGNNTFVAVGDYGVILTSPDGITWTGRTSPVTREGLFAVTYGDNTFVAVGDYGALLTSPDGTTWTERAVSASYERLCAVSYGNDTFVAVGYTGYYGSVILTSPDGMTWTQRTSPVRNSLNAVAYAKGSFMAVGEVGTIATSLDGITWTEGIRSIYDSLNALSYGNKTFVAVGDYGVILSSPDGITWTERTSPVTTDIFAVTYDNDAFVAVGDYGVILSSPDGITWTERTSPTSNQLNAVAYANGTFVTVGDGGTILQSGSSYPLIVFKSGTGSGTVASSPSGIDCGTTCSARFPKGTEVTLTATPDTGSTFTGWSGDCSGPGACKVTTNSAISVTAAFTAKQYEVTATVSGGNGTVFPSRQAINYGGIATITINPRTGYRVAAITDNGLSMPVTRPYVISYVTEPHAVVVTFSSKYLLTVSKQGTGEGRVVSAPAAIDCGTTCSGNLNQGTVVTLSAAPQAGSVFTGWSGGCSGTRPTCRMTMKSAVNVMATFDIKTYKVSALSGGHGTVSPVTQNITHGGTATITITPATGYHVATIKDNGVMQPLTNPYVITNVTAPHAVVITFTNRQALTVTKDGTGKGTVTSVPAGINCGATCTGNFVQGSTVTLRAVPQISSTFTGWSGGGCSGTGTCKVTIDGAQSVTATFALKQFVISVSAPGGHGTVTPATQNTDYGTTATITITPDTGYRVAAIRDNGVSKKVGMSYVIKNVTANHTVVVTFARRQVTPFHPRPSWHRRRGPSGRRVRSFGRP